MSDDRITEKQWREEVRRWIKSCEEKDAELEWLREELQAKIDTLAACQVPLR